MENNERDELKCEGQRQAYKAMLNSIKQDIADAEGYLEYLASHNKTGDVKTSKDFIEGKLATLYKLGFIMQAQLARIDKPQATITEQLCSALRVK